MNLGRTSPLLRKRPSALLLPAAALLLCHLPLAADVRFDQTTRMTGGAMMSMIKLAGKFGGQNLADPLTSTISIKGNRQATRSKDSLQIIDLDKETITDINLKNQTYSVITFAQMQEALSRLGGKKQDDADIQVEVKAENTGKTATVEGRNLEEMLFAVNSTISDKEKKGSAEIRMEMSVWYSSAKPAGWEEVEAFQKRFGAKLGSLPNLGIAAMQKGSAKQMAEIGRKMADHGGIPVLTVMRMIPGDPKQAAEMEKQAQAQQNAPPPPSAGETATAAITEKLGRLGGLGGFGRKKKQAEDAAASVPASSETKAKPQESANKLPVEPSFSSTASMMDFLTETSNVAKTTVDDADFTLPAGFKQVENPMVKALR